MKGKFDDGPTTYSTVPGTVDGLATHKVDVTSSFSNRLAACIFKDQGETIHFPLYFACSHLILYLCTSAV